MVRVPVRLVSWEDVEGWCFELAERIRASGWLPDFVVAIARGGYVPARLLCDYLGVDRLASIQVKHWPSAAERAERAEVKVPLEVDLSGLRVLIVDDIADTGDSIIVARDYIVRRCRPREVRVATMQWISSVCKIRPDYFVDEVKEWVWYQYPWTRLEDTVQFIRRIVREEKLSEFTYDEIVAKFREWYGVDMGERIYRAALDMLVRLGDLEFRDGRYRVLKVR